MQVKKILFPIDFSANALYSLNYACDMAKLLSAELILLHVVEYITYPAFYDIVQESQEDIIEKLHEKNVEKMRQLSKDFKDIKLINKIARGTPSDEILKLAHNEKIDLIIMATHGHTNILHSLIGSLTEKIVRKAACPVLTLKPKDFISEMP